MLLRRCRSVHTVGMRVSIVVASLDGHLRVVEVRTLRPGRLLLPRPGVRHILECPAEADVRPGDRFYTYPAAPGGRYARGDAPIV